MRTEKPVATRLTSRTTTKNARGEFRPILITDARSEEYIGEWMESRGCREEMIILTKYTTNYRGDQRGKASMANAQGNHVGSARRSVDQSLKNLKTDFIDVLYVHWWDYTTSVEEVMRGLHQLVMSGKVLYLAVSDTPAWIVSKANQYARDHALTPFVIYQGMWSVLVRDLEVDVLPMVRAEGMAIAPWGALAQGHIKSAAQIEELKKSGEGFRDLASGKRIETSSNELAIKASETLEAIGKRHGDAPPTSIALAWILAKEPYVFPIIGGRKIEHLEANIKALEIRLTKEDMEQIDQINPPTVLFPMNRFGRDPASREGPQGGNFLVQHAGELEYLPHARSLTAPAGY